MKASTAGTTKAGAHGAAAWLAVAVAMLIGMTWAAPGRAATPASAMAPAQPPTVASLNRQLMILQQQIAAASKSPEKLADLRAQANSIQSSADQLVAARSADLATVEHQLTQLGTAEGPAAVRRQRRTLTSQRASLENQVNEAKLLSVAADQAFDSIAAKRNSAFTAQLFQQTASPLSPDFWGALVQESGGDWKRLTEAVVQAAVIAWRADEPLGLLVLGGAIAIAAALLLPIRTLLERLGRRWAAEKSENQKFRRSAYGLWMAVVDTVLPALAAMALHLGAKWGGLLSSKADALAKAAVFAVVWGAGVVALGRVLIAAKDPDRRVLPIDDATARRVRAFPAVVAVVTGLGLMLIRLNDIIGAGLAATVAASCLVAIAYSAVAGLMLLAIAAGQKATEAETAAETARSSSWTLVSLALSAAILASLGAMFAGYTTLAARVSGQVFWLGVLGAMTYLLLRFIDDLCSALFSPHGWASRALFSIFGLRRSTIAQIGVLSSALLQIMVLLGTVTLALTPFGRSGQDLLSHLGDIGQPIKIGSIVLSPSALMAGLVSFAIGVPIVRYVQGWLNRRFLPVTDWDAGVRNSVSTGVGYLGMALAILWALATAGLGFQQIALVASALSVGIGFGLQQVVQNFVSGLILLVERPVKAGDWVNVGGQEGNVVHIRVRATEIETFDRTTLIVPNSDLITKTVQNKTLGDPRGRVQLQLAIGDASQAGQAGELIMSILKADAEVLEDPAPSVFIDSVVNGVVNFNCFAFVASPRAAYGVRSRLYFEVLRRMLEAHIIFPGGGVPTMVIEPGPGLRDLVEQTAQRVPQPAPPPAPAPASPSEPTPSGRP